MATDAQGLSTGPVPVPKAPTSSGGIGRFDPIDLSTGSSASRREVIGFASSTTATAAQSPMVATGSGSRSEQNKEWLRGSPWAWTLIKADLRGHDHEDVEALLRYVANHDGMLNYAEAIAANLPIGSGNVKAGLQDFVWAGAS